MLRFLWPLALLLAANVVMLSRLSLSMTYLATWCILLFLPGWSVLESFSPTPRQLISRVVLALGLGMCFTVLLTLYVNYLPGPMTAPMRTQVIVLIDALVVALLLVGLWRRRNGDQALVMPDRQEILTVGTIMVVALAVRLPLVGYREFHEDEVEVVSLALRGLRGEDYAFFLHRKGPVQALLPMAGWLLSDGITEGWARSAFLIASVCSVVAAYMAGRDIGNSRWVGVIAGLLLAVNGYSVSFARMVQYQSVVILLSILILWLLWTSFRRRVWCYLPLIGLFTSVMLLAHFDGLLYLPVILVSTVLCCRSSRRLRRRDGLSIALGLLLLAIPLLGFYLPFVQDVQFTHTLNYLHTSRVGSDFLYNNLDQFILLDRVYSSRFYLPFLAVLFLLFLIARTGEVKLNRLALLLILAGVGSTVVCPQVWMVGHVNLSIIPWLVLTGAVAYWLRRKERTGELMAFLWGVVPFLGYVFLVKAPKTHVYVVYPGLVVVVGIAGMWLWRSRARLHTWARIAFVAVFCIFFIVVGYYQVLLYGRTMTDAMQLRTNWSSDWRSVVYRALPKLNTYFSSPYRVGWKVMGCLVLDGVIEGNFRSANENFKVPSWYCLEAASRSCFDYPANYFVANPEGDHATASDLLSHGYGLTGEVVVEETVTLALYERDRERESCVEYVAEDFEERFDAKTSLESIMQIQGRRFHSPLSDARFGPSIRLVAYELSSMVPAAGDQVDLTLWWQSDEKLNQAYRAFVHLETDRMWAQHDDSPACRLPTDQWRPGQVVEGEFRLSLPPDMPPGQYPLTLGLYDPATGERLLVYDESGQITGSSFPLTQLSVMAITSPGPVLAD